jgi:TFIIF-interacting CTD phosphatase-like protein
VVVLTDWGHKEHSYFSQAHKICPHIDKTQNYKPVRKKILIDFLTCIRPRYQYKVNTKFKAGKTNRARFKACVLDVGL